MATAKRYFPARYKGPFETVRARMNFASFLAGRGDGLTIAALAGDCNWLELDDSDKLPLQWGDGEPGRVDAQAVRVTAPYSPFMVSTLGYSAQSSIVDLTVSGGEMGKTYLLTVGIVLSNGETIMRSAALSIAQL